jgi:hypothetical protein
MVGSLVAPVRDRNLADRSLIVAKLYSLIRPVRCF